MTQVVAHQTKHGCRIFVPARDRRFEFTHCAVTVPLQKFLEICQEGCRLRDLPEPGKHGVRGCVAQDAHNFGGPFSRFGQRDIACRAQERR